MLTWKTTVTTRSGNPHDQSRLQYIFFPGERQDRPADVAAPIGKSNPRLARAIDSENRSVFKAQRRRFLLAAIPFRNSLLGFARDSGDARTALKQSKINL